MLPKSARGFVDNSEVIPGISTGYPQDIPSTNGHKKKVIHKYYDYYYFYILYDRISNRRI